MTASPQTMTNANACVSSTGLVLTGGYVDFVNFEHGDCVFKLDNALLARSGSALLHKISVISILLCHCAAYFGQLI